ncbi:MAG: tetratricopeptide repeat protein, partial [Thermoanaerobaculia bacterium]|nr:tetratricopeptide repeat protein [Thermoanaerobaculia bacterium]
EYLAEGIVEGTIRRLSKLPRLRVMARTTAFRYRGSAFDPLAIGTELGVRAVLSGRMLRRGETISISLELADVTDGTLVWGERYQGTNAELADLADRIGEQAALALRPQLTASQRLRLGARRRSAPAAFELYLKGMFQWNKREPAAMAAAISLFRQANEADPAFAEPYAGLAEAYAYLGFLEVSAPGEAFPKARAAARRALELDPSLSDAHAALGWIAALHDWNWAESERELREAVLLNPSSAVAHHWLGLVLSLQRDFAAASPELDLAHELDPLSPILATALGLTRYHRGDLEEAIRLYRNAFEAGQHFVPLHFYLGVALDAAGRHAEALEQFDEATRLSPQGTIWLGGRGHCLGRMGRATEARAVLTALLERRERQYTSAFAVALVLLGLGEEEPALAWLDRALDERAAWLTTLAVDQRWARLHGHPRFGAMLERIGLRPG